MRGLGTLVAMQLRDKLNLSQWRSWRGNLYSIFATVLKYGIIIAGIWYLLNELSDMRLLSILPGIPQSVLAVIFTAMLAVSTVVATVAIMHSMYFTSDNALLLTLPASRTTVFTSKLIVFYVYELIRNSTYMLPVFIAYGIVNGMPLLYYVWLIPAFCVVTALPVSIGALLSIPLMIVTNFIKQHKVLQSVLLVGVVVAGVYAMTYAISAIPEEINLVGTWGTTFWEIQTWLTNFSYNYRIFTYMLVGIVGERVGVVVTLFGASQITAWLYMLAVVAVVIGVTYLIVRPLFFYMASTPFEYKKVVIKTKHTNKKHSPIFSTFIKDSRLMLRNNARILSLLYVVVGMPLVSLLLNKIYTAIDTSRVGNSMIVAFNIGIMLIISMSSNIDVAHIYSQDGASSYLNKTAPVRSIWVMLIRLAPHAVLVSISIALSAHIFGNAIGITQQYTIMLAVAIIAMYLAHMFISAERDIMNPQWQQYAATGSHDHNPNDMACTLIAYVSAVIIGWFAYTLYYEDIYSVWPKLMIVGILLLAFRAYMFVSKTCLYYKER